MKWSSWSDRCNLICCTVLHTADRSEGPGLFSSQNTARWVDILACLHWGTFCYECYGRLDIGSITKCTTVGDIMYFVAELSKPNPTATRNPTWLLVWGLFGNVALWLQVQIQEKIQEEHRSNERMNKVRQSWTKLNNVEQSWTKLNKVEQSWTKLI